MISWFHFYTLTIFVVNFAPPTSVLGSPTSRSQIGLCRSFAASFESLCNCIGITDIWHTAEALFVELLRSGVGFGKSRGGRRRLLQLRFSNSSRLRRLELPDVVGVGGVDSIRWSIRFRSKQLESVNANDHQTAYRCSWEDWPAFFGRVERGALQRRRETHVLGLKGGVGVRALLLMFRSGWTKRILEEVTHGRREWGE